MDNKKRNILLGILIVGVISMTVAFAALSTTLSINGTASLPTTSWNIHFDNGVDNTSGTHANGKVNKGTITGLQFAATSISNFTATLYQPNDEVVYNFDIVNEGTIDGQLDNFSKTLTCNSASCDMITYTITCEDASHNDANQSDYILASGESVSCEMKIKYNDQTNSNNGVYSQGAVSATASATWLYKQVEDSNNSGGNSGSGSGGSGGNEQSNPYETTFTGTYGYDYTDAETLGNGGSSEWVNTLDPNAIGYLRNDGTKIETCGVYGSGQAGTVCLTSSYYNGSYSSAGSYASDFEDVSDFTYDITTSEGLEATGLKGYSLAKAEEMLSKGASSCEVNEGGVMCDMYDENYSYYYCYIDNGYYFYIGDVFCNGLSVSSDGSATGHSAP